MSTINKTNVFSSLSYGTSKEKRPSSGEKTLLTLQNDSKKQE